MSDWGIIVAAGIVSLLAWAHLEDYIVSAIRLRRIKRAGRSITANQALDEYNNGLGLLVENKSLLPGRWWYLRNVDRPEDCDLVTGMREFGYVVVCGSAKERSAIEAYRGKVEEMLEPFDE